MTRVLVIFSFRNITKIFFGNFQINLLEFGRNIVKTLVSINEEEKWDNHKS